MIADIWNPSKDIILDDAAFEKASKDLSELSVELDDLRKSIEDKLGVLKTGFDTPAGRKFIQSCEENLLTPIDQQKLALEHISSNLSQAKDKYAAVFSEYETLNNTLRSFQA